MKNFKFIKLNIKFSEIVKKKITIVKGKDNKYVALCPFHNEKTPSFFINDESSTYYCFGCKAHGNVFNFIMEYDKCSYKVALYKIAKYNGVFFKKENFFNKKNQIFDILQITCDFYKKQLNLNNGGEARKYLSKRNIFNKVILDFEIGYCPRNSDFLLQTLKKQYNIVTILKSGVFRKKKKQII